MDGDAPTAIRDGAFGPAHADTAMCISSVRRSVVARLDTCDGLFSLERQRKITKMERRPTDRASLEHDCDLAFFIASGPGGQRRNKVETGVRLIHRPTGVRVTATERHSRQANREAVFTRMAARLQKRQRVLPTRKPMRPTPASRFLRLQAKHRANSLFWPPMSRDNQEIDLLFRLFHQAQQALRLPVL